MTSLAKCPKCGTPIEGWRPYGACPRCAEPTAPDNTVRTVRTDGDPPIPAPDSTSGISAPARFGIAATPTDVGGIMSVPGAVRPVVVVAPKSMGISILLTFLFGPLGMLYTTVAGALIMMVISGIVFVMTAGLGLIITWPICIVWGAVATSSYNKKLMSGA